MQYSVILTKTTYSEAKLIVTAKSEEEAEAIAQRKASRSLDWYITEEDCSVEYIEELDE